MNTRKIKQTAQTTVKPALTRLKELSPDNRLAVMEILEARTYKDAKPLIEQLVGFPCSINLLWKFRDWHSTEQELVRDTNLVEQIENFLRQRNGDWSVERIRDAAISFLMMQSLSIGDVKAFATITRVPARLELVRLKNERLELDRLKFEESLRKKVDAGVDALAKAFLKNPEALKLYQAARNLLNDQQPEIEPQPVQKPNEMDNAA